ncbi:MAG: neocarzinostatin apoprotein domain-containing protein [Acidimicrobiales bacterium]
MLIVAAGLGVATSDSDPADVRAGEGTPTTATPADPSAQLRVEPSSNLEPDQVVTITLPVEPSDDAIVAQCASEAAGASDPTPWCDLAYDQVSESGDGHFQFAVLRSIQTSRGIIDCAESAERCVIGVRSGGVDYLAAISFRADLAAAADPVFEIDDSSAADGEGVTVVGSGFTPDTEIFLMQCQRAPAGDGPDTCDDARSVSFTTDSSGAFEREFLVYREIFTSGWVDCEPCVLYAASYRQNPAVVPIDVAPGAGSSRPTVRIIPDGPYDPGQLVQLQGTGFQAGSTDIDIGWCRFNTDDPETEAQGAGPDYATCAYPGEPPVSDEAGNFVVDDFPMPDDAFGFGGATCQEPTARCGLAWHRYEGSHPVFITFFEMNPG